HGTALALRSASRLTVGQIVRNHKRPALLFLAFLAWIVLNIPDRSRHIRRIQVYLPLATRETLGRPPLIVLDVAERMETPLVQGLCCRAFQLDHQLFDFHLWSSYDQMYVIRQDGACPDWKRGISEIRGKAHSHRTRLQTV